MVNLCKCICCIYIYIKNDLVYIVVYNIVYNVVYFSFVKFDECKLCHNEIIES